MDLHQLFLEKNACYIAGTKMVPRGIMIHSTGADNPNLRRYVQPDDGLLGAHPYSNHWNNYHPGGKDIGPHTFVNDGTGYCAVCGGRQVCTHAMIGKLADGDVATYQLLPWDWQGWHSGKGTKGQANRLGYIGFEICEDALTDPEYFLRTYNEAVDFCAYICELYGFDPEGVTPEGYPVILDHVTGCELGIAAPHGDVGHWWPKFGKYLDDIRKDVKIKLSAAYWNTVDEVPEWGRPTIKKLVDKGALQGVDDEGNLRLTFDLVRLYVTHDRLGLYDMKGGEK